MEAGERRAARMTVVARERPEQAPPDESGTEASPASPGLTAYSLDRRYELNGLRAEGRWLTGVFDPCSAHTISSNLIADSDYSITGYGLLCSQVALP
jgi:hypothetical protein